jgi:hypothetical protein
MEVLITKAIQSASKLVSLKISGYAYYASDNPRNREYTASGRFRNNRS